MQEVNAPGKKIADSITLAHAKNFDNLEVSLLTKKDVTGNARHSTQMHAAPHFGISPAPSRNAGSFTSKERRGLITWPTAETVVTTTTEVTVTPTLVQNWVKKPIRQPGKPQHGAGLSPTGSGKIPTKSSPRSYHEKTNRHGGKAGNVSTPTQHTRAQRSTTQQSPVQPNRKPAQPRFTSTKHPNPKAMGKPESVVTVPILD